ncbi:MAG: RNA polymerase sigma factor [Gemmatimonadales bacterium]|nr:RNA polymerase sigma factor [Gemmatimonadales bacterium]
MDWFVADHGLQSSGVNDFTSKLVLHDNHEFGLGYRAVDSGWLPSPLEEGLFGDLRVARSIVRSADVADEVVQEAWAAILKGLPRFEGRSSLKTWIFRIVSNRAKSRAVKEVRSVPMSAMGGESAFDPGCPSRVLLPLSGSNDGMIPIEAVLFNHHHWADIDLAWCPPMKRNPTSLLVEDPGRTWRPPRPTDPLLQS